MTHKALALTCGEPAGIAPDITAKAWAALRHDRAHGFFLIGDMRLMASRAPGLPLAAIASAADAAQVFAEALPVLDRPLSVLPRPGAIDPATAPQVIAAIDEAADLAIRGEAAAMVTNPIQKEALYAAGFRHQGHTDYLAHLAGLRGHRVQEVMMLVAAGLRAVPVTVHIPLADVPRQLTTDLIVAQGRVVARELQDRFGIMVPRLAVTGLNPHTGENGAMGHEDQDVIAPAVRALQAEGIAARGPIAADTAFHPEAREGYDAILCMYHDQALIPVKTLDFHGGVNVSLGLPFVRTSPDHGTALSLAGSGAARPDSLIAALKLAATMARHGRG